MAYLPYLICYVHRGRKIWTVSFRSNYLNFTKQYPAYVGVLPQYWSFSLASDGSTSSGLILEGLLDDSRLRIGRALMSPERSGCRGWLRFSRLPVFFKPAFIKGCFALVLSPAAKKKCVCFSRDKTFIVMIMCGHMWYSTIVQHTPSRLQYRHTDCTTS